VDREHLLNDALWTHLTSQAEIARFVVSNLTPFSFCHKVVLRIYSPAVFSVVLLQLMLLRALLGPLYPRRDIVKLQSILCILHLEHGFTPSHLRCFNRQETQALVTATQLFLVADALSCKITTFALEASLPLSDEALEAEVVMRSVSTLNIAGPVSIWLKSLWWLNCSNARAPRCQNVYSWNY